MLRVEILSSIKELSDDLVSAGVDALFDQLADYIRPTQVDRKGISIREILFIINRLNIKHASYDNAKFSIIDIFDLRNLYDDEFWEKILSGIAISSSPQDRSTKSDILDFDLIYPMRSNLKFFFKHSPKIINLLERDENYIKVFAESIREDASNYSPFTIILPESNNEASSISRLTTALSAIESLYEVLTSLDGIGTSNLVVISCDSGSDKSFDLLGISKVVDSIKETFIAIWDRRVFNKHAAAGMLIENLSKTLPVMERIHKMRENGSLSAEEAEIMKRKAIEGITGIVSAGVIIPEMEKQSPEVPRLLMRPEQKLLAAPSEQSATAEPQPPRRKAPRKKSSKKSSSRRTTVAKGA